MPRISSSHSLLPNSLAFRKQYTWYLRYRYRQTTESRPQRRPRTSSPAKPGHYREHDLPLSMSKSVNAMDTVQEPHAYSRSNRQHSWRHWRASLLDEYKSSLESLTIKQKFLLGCAGSALFALQVVFDIRYNLSTDDPGCTHTMTVNHNEDCDEIAVLEATKERSDNNVTSSNESPKARLARARKEIEQMVKMERRSSPQE